MTNLITPIESNDRQKTIDAWKHAIIRDEILDESKEAQKRRAPPSVANAIVGTPAAECANKVVASSEMSDGFKRRPPRQRHYSVKPNDSSEKA